MKNANKSTMVTNALTVSRNATIVSVVMPAPNMERAGRINYFHRIAEEAGALSIKAAFYLGLELMKAKAELQHGEFGKWVDANCDFSQRTAQNYIHTAYIYLSEKFDVEELLERSDSARQDAVEETSASFETKNLNDLYVDLGIAKRSKSNLGGKREGAGRKRKLTDEEQLAAAADQIAHSAELSKTEVNGYIASLYEAGIARGGFGALESADLQDVCTTLSDILKKAKEILASRKAKQRIEDR